MNEPVWKGIMRRQPFVCPRCSRRFPRRPVNGNCPDHSSVVKVWDQSDLIASWDEP